MIHEVVHNTSSFEELSDSTTNFPRQVYACPNLYAPLKITDTDLNTPTWMRAAGAVSGMLGLEGAMDELAYALKIDPLELRLLNVGTSFPEVGYSISRSSGKKSASRNRPDHVERLLAAGDGVGQRRIRRVVGDVLPADEVAQEGAPLPGDVVADRPPQHRIAGFERVEDGALGHRSLDHLDRELDVSLDAGEDPQVRRQHDMNHGRVWTSTERTAGRSRTMGAQLSPASAEA